MMTSFGKELANAADPAVGIVFNDIRRTRRPEIFVCVQGLMEIEDQHCCGLIAVCTFVNRRQVSTGRGCSLDCGDGHNQPEEVRTVHANLADDWDHVDFRELTHVINLSNAI
jgi:hypothetical protein